MDLVSTRSIDWTAEELPSGTFPEKVHFGKGAQPIQVGLATSEHAPSRAVLRSLFQDRKGRLPIFVIVAVNHGDSVSVFGPDADSEPILMKTSTAAAVLNSILDQDDEISAYQRAIFLWRSKQTTEMVGFTNNGLFASHFIRTSISSHARWDEAQKRSVEIQSLRNKELLVGLGYEISASPSSTLLLSAQGREKRVVAILLDRSENFEAKSPRLHASPIEWSLGVAAHQGAPWVIAIKDSQLRLYPARDGVGVGQKSQAETYFEIDLMTVDEDKVGLLALIFSAEALADDGTAEGLLSDSKNFASELGVRLRERVYEQVVPRLATEIANQLRSKGQELDSKGLELSYELTLRVLFRLLFQAYAEDRGLLPAGRNEIYDSNSMKRWAERFLERESDDPFGESSTIWFDLMQVWDAIAQGNPEMQVPAYDGGLFGSDPDLHPTGSLIRSLAIPDHVMGPALRALVVDDVTEDGVPGAVDFRSLSVREFGTIYEGLLESSLSVADQDLTVDSNGSWIPATEKDKVLARQNEVYFHSASGKRKTTGSYYTPSFIVDYLIERSVEPALNDHLAKVKALIESGDQAAAYKLFFDFRVADLAMGSAHFLVVAIDKIESTMRSFLVQPGNNIEGVNAELMRLEEAARAALGKDEAAYAEIERAGLLRRQIARRCIYGLDVNPLAVELSRLAIWIHTFVPGLPMSSLEHNLVCANSLTGIGSVDEGLNALIPERASGQSTLFDDIVERSLSEAKTLLEEVANADEADKKQALKAAEAAKLARDAAAKSKMIFDLAVANRNGIVSSAAALSEDDLADLYSNETVLDFISTLKPAHMPYLFPEVFLRDNAGFDALVGNPPWEEATIEEPKFWLSIRPGLLGLGPNALRSEIESLRSRYPREYLEFQKQKEALVVLRKALLANPYPGLGTGDIDLYSVFAWKNLDFLSPSGALGLVFPRSILTTAGSGPWRQAALGAGSLDLFVLKNKRRWVFEDVGEQYAFALLVLQAGPQPRVYLQGPASDIDEFRELLGNKIVLSDEWVVSIQDGLGVPLLSNPQEVALINQLGKHPAISDQGIRFVREFDATNDRKTFDSGLTKYEQGFAPVVGGKGFNLWKPLTGKTYAWAEMESSDQALVRKLKNQIRNRRSAFYNSFTTSEVSAENLAVRNPRLVFRDIARASDPRTAIFTLVPAGVYLTNKAPYVLLKTSEPAALFYHLGVFASRVFDWQVKRFVELGMNFFILEKLRFPEYDPQSELHASISQLAKNLITDNGQVDLWSPDPTTFDRGIELHTDAKDLEHLDLLVAQAAGIETEELPWLLEQIPLIGATSTIDEDEDDD